VQLYVGDVDASVARPRRELRAWAKVDLDAGQSERLTFHLAARDFSYWSSTASDWVLEPGEFTLAIGASSRDLRLMIALDIAAPVRPVALDAMASLDEWLADPAGGPVIREVVGTDAAGRPRGILGDDELRAVVGNFPIGALTAFPGTGLDGGTVDELLRRLRD
jgi:beta-glucosidase